MLRVRLKADGRLVEILSDGRERAITFSPEQPPGHRHNVDRVEDAIGSDREVGFRLHDVKLEAGRLLRAVEMDHRREIHLDADDTAASR